MVGVTGSIPVAPTIKPVETAALCAFLTKMPGAPRSVNKRRTVPTGCPNLGTGWAQCSPGVPPRCHRRLGRTLATSRPGVAPLAEILARVAGPPVGHGGPAPERWGWRRGGEAAWRGRGALGPDAAKDTNPSPPGATPSTLMRHMRHEEAGRYLLAAAITMWCDTEQPGGRCVNRAES
jgi:hypothetical protein